MYVAPSPTEFTLKNIRQSSQSEWLQIPEMTIVDDDARDVHLVFEYNAGDTILGYTAPRSNRLYFVHDPNGALMQQLEPYH